MVFKKIINIIHSMKTAGAFWSKTDIIIITSCIFSATSHSSFYLPVSHMEALGTNLWHSKNSESMFTWCKWYWWLDISSQFCALSAHKMPATAGILSHNISQNHPGVGTHMIPNNYYMSLTPIKLQDLVHCFSLVNSLLKKSLDESFLPAFFLCC